MSPNLEIIEQFLPLVLCLMAVIPLLFLYAFNKSEEKPKPANYHFLIAYLSSLGIVAIAVLVLKAIEVMPVDNSDRTLFICALLIIACIDQSLILFPLQAKLKFDLVGFLLYLVILLTAIPLLWQISRHVIPLEISSQHYIMNTIEITLMLTMVVLCFVNGILKKKQTKQNSDGK